MSWVASNILTVRCDGCGVRYGASVADFGKSVRWSQKQQEDFARYQAKKQAEACCSHDNWKRRRTK